MPLASVVFILCVLYGVDQRLKHSSASGFVLKDADWTICAENVGVAWQSLYESDAWGVLSKEGDPLREDIVELRKLLGIRLSPKRWSAWMGSGATVSVVDDDFLLVTRPGVLLRFVDMVHESPEIIGSKSYGPYYYRWHEGYLCLSKSQELLARVQSDTIHTIRTIRKRKDEQAVVLENAELICIVGMVDSLPLRGNYRGDTSKVSFSALKPFSLFPLLRDYVPDWYAGKGVQCFQGNLGVQMKAYPPELGSDE